MAGPANSAHHGMRNEGLPVDKDAHAKAFTSRHVAECMVRHQLGALSTPPGTTDAPAADAADVVLWFALLNDETACEIRGLPSQIATLLEGTDLKAEVVNLICGPQGGRRFVFAVGETEFAFRADLLALEEFVGARPKVLLDLEGVASDLVSRCQRPLLRIDFDFPRRGTKPDDKAAQRYSHLRVV